MLCLVLFWIIFTIGIILSIVIEPLIFGMRFYEFYQGYSYISFSSSEEIIQFVLWLFVFPAFVIVFVGTLILRNRKTTTPEMIKSNIKPTLAASSLGFFLLTVA